MNLYKQAVMEGWLFPSKQGMLTITQVAQLPLLSKTTSNTSLDDVAIKLHEEISKQAQISFVNVKSTDNTNALKLDLVKDLIQTVETANAAKVLQQSIASQNAVIKDLIAKKQLDELGSKSIAELEAMIK